MGFYLRKGEPVCNKNPTSGARIMHWKILLELGSPTTARTYPRVLPASLPSVSEPDRNQGGSLVLPGLELLPVPEPLFNFELETKDERSVTNLSWSQHRTKTILMSYFNWVIEIPHTSQGFSKLPPHPSIWVCSFRFQRGGLVRLAQQHPRESEITATCSAFETFPF